MRSRKGGERHDRHRETLGDSLGLWRVPDEELVGILGGMFPLGRWESGDRVTYSIRSRARAQGGVRQARPDRALRARADRRAGRNVCKSASNNLDTDDA
jgi:hypothetical protein